MTVLRYSQNFISLAMGLANPRKKGLTLAIVLCGAVASASMQGCGGSQPAPPDTVEAVAAGPDTIFETTSEPDSAITEGMDCKEVFEKLRRQRFVGFPRMKFYHPKEWDVCNTLYGVVLLTKRDATPYRLDSLVDYRLKSAMSMELLEGKNYAQAKDILNRFRPDDPRDKDDDPDEANKQVGECLESFISYHYQAATASLAGDPELTKLIANDHIAWNLLVKSQLRLIDALNPPRTNDAERHELSRTLHKVKAKTDIDLYLALKKQNYQTSDTLYEKLTDQYAFYDEYNDFIRDIKEQDLIGIGRQIKALTDEQTNWMNYMYVRRLIGKKLRTEKAAKIFDNASNRLQKWHIVQLKNRFKGYGYCSPAFRSSLLSDSCSYTEMYKYKPMNLDARF